MTLNQLQTLTDEEKALALLLVFPVPEDPHDMPRHLTWYKHDALVKKLLDSFPRVLPPGHPTYSSLLTKLGIQHEIKYEQPPAPVVENPNTGSNEVTGSAQ